MVMCRELARNKMDRQGETQWQGMNDIYTWFWKKGKLSEILFKSQQLETQPGMRVGVHLATEKKQEAEEWSRWGCRVEWEQSEGGKITKESPVGRLALWAEGKGEGEGEIWARSHLS